MSMGQEITISTQMTNLSHTTLGQPDGEVPPQVIDMATGQGKQINASL